MIIINHCPVMDKEITDKTGYKQGDKIKNGLILDVIDNILQNKFNIKIEQKFSNIYPYKTYFIDIVKP